MITGNRWAVAALMLAVMFVIVLLLGAFGPPAVEQLLMNKFGGTLFGSLLTAIVTTVTLVLSFSQFTLSQDFQNLGTSRNELDEVIKFRRDVECRIDIDFTPALPRELIYALLKGVEDKLTQLAEILDKDKASNNSGKFSDINEYIRTAINHSKKERHRIKEIKLGSLTGLLAVVNHNYTWKFLAARKLRKKYSDSLSASAKDAFEELLETLKFFGPIRDYFKTLYIQDQVIQVSRDILYASLPTLALTGYMAWMFNPATVAGWIGFSNFLGFNSAFLLISISFVLSLIPFALLLSYLLRLLTVIRHVLTVGPFIIRKSQIPQSE